MSRKFNLDRHRDIKGRLIQQVGHAKTDQRIESLAMRFYILALRLRKMNESNGMTGGKPIARPTLNEAKETFQRLGWTK